LSVNQHRETVKEAQLRKYNAAIEKQFNDEMEAEARDWEKKAEIAIQKAK
jgi:capsid protein